MIPGIVAKSVEPAGIYISNAGNDSNDGLSSGSPLETLSAAVGKNPAAGTSIFLKRGDIWREELSISTSGTSGSPVTYGAYGSGSAPIISGASVFTFTQRITYTGWAAEGETVALDKSSTNTQGLIFNTTGKIFAGQGGWTSDGDYTIAAMEVVFASGIGTFSQNCVAEIYTMDGVNLGTVVDTSDNLLVTNATTTAKFGGMAASLSDGVDYALVIRRADSSSDGSNAMFVRLDNGGDTWSGAYDTWAADKVRGGHLATYEFGVKLYEGGALPYYTAYDESPSTVYYDDSPLSENTTSKETLATGEWWDDTVNDRVYIYDNPSGATVEGSDQWNSDYTGFVTQVFSDNVLLTKNTVSKATLATGEWFDDDVNDRVYLYDDPTSAVIEVCEARKCVNTQSKSYVTIQDLTLEKGASNGVWIAGHLARFDGIIIQRCTIKEAWNHGILAAASGFGATGFGVSTDVQILNNTFSDNGIQVTADSAGTGFAINIAGAGPDDYLSDVIVADNTCSSGPAGFKGDWFSNDIIFERNYIEVDGTGFSTDGGQYLTWRYNVIVGNGAQNGYAFSIFRWEGAPGPPYGFAPIHNKILNNTVYNYDKCVSLSEDMSEIIIKNNIFYSDIAGNTLFWRDDSATQSPLTIDYNMYYTGVNDANFNMFGDAVYDFSGWQGLGFEANGYEDDPEMVDPDNSDYTLQVGSPCIDAGDDVGLTTDFVLTAVPQGTDPDIGAYEYT